MPFLTSSASSSASSSSNPKLRPKSVKKVTSRSVKASTKPQPRPQSAKKILASLPKVPLKKTTQGAIAKLPRVFPGRSSRSTSSRSVGSVGGKSATLESRSSGISKFSGQKKAGTTESITQASVKGHDNIGGSIPGEVVTEKVLNGRSGVPASVCSSIGFDAELTSLNKLKERWARPFVNAASFAQPLRGDDFE